VAQINNQIFAKSKNQIKKHNMPLFSVICIVYSLICGGAYGAEDLISSCGPGLGLVVLIVFPVIWSIPQGLVSAELGSALPEEGGYYKWTQRAFGEFWGYQVGWWRTVSCYIDSAIYVVLAAGYFSVMMNLTDFETLLLKVFLISVITYINIRGISAVGKFSVIMTGFVLGFTALFVIFCIFNMKFNPFVPFIAEGQGIWESVGLGVIISIWLYSGFESIGTMAGELKNPKIIPKAIICSIPLIVITYVFPVMFGLAEHGNWSEWSSDGDTNLVSIAGDFGLPWFSMLSICAAIVCNLSLYNSYIGSVSRGFFVLSEDNLSPPFMSKVNEKYGTPHIAILSMAVVSLALMFFDFETLVVIDVVLLCACYLMCYLSAIKLRIKEPGLTRPFKIYGKTGFLVFISVVPMILCVISMFVNGKEYIIGGCTGLLTGVISYIFFKNRYGGIDGEHKISRKNRRFSLLLSLASVITIIITAVFV
jgi:amino acid transporter